ELKQLLPEVDFVTLHVPLNDNTRHLIDAEAFTLMRNDAILINTARGGVVDEAAMLTALQTDQIAGAYVDVFEEEPLPKDSPLWDAPNLIISPHIADSIAGWERHFADFFAQNLERWLSGEPLLNVVDVERGY
ncbi:MAG: NAD(P)-dependent oxidoreductase, partial [Chloroflexota bacterium]